MAAGAVAAQTLVYRIDLKGGGALWASQPPRENGGVLVFIPYPRGPLTSIRRSEILRVLGVPVPPVRSAAALRPGDQRVLGATGASGAAAAPASAGRNAAPGNPTGLGRPGERDDGTALFNPDRAYRPEWDSRQVPGLNLGLPNSPDDYREGLTLAFPPANAVQSAPGEPPMMPPSTGEVPR